MSNRIWIGMSALILIAAGAVVWDATATAESCCGANALATCSGSSSCTACKNCKSCKHCTSGGTCGKCK